MEPWQIAHVQKNLDDLTRFTSCNSSLVAILQKRDILSINDISKLEAKRKSDGAIAESSLLFEILITRAGAYDALIEALRETLQTGSLRILEQASATKSSNPLKLEHITISSTWNELADSLKTELENKLVTYQTRTVTLGQLAKYYDLAKLDGKILIELANGNTPTIINNQIPNQLQYYVYRTIETRNRLRSEVFQHICSDLFLIQGLERKDLSCLAGDYETDVSGNQLQRLTVRFILLEYERDFESICKLASEPVHWIKYLPTQKCYEWVKSSGSVKNLQEYVHTSQVQLTEEELGMSTVENNVKVISDSPGMGKTMLLVNIAHDFLKRDLDSDTIILIRFIVLKEMVQELDSTNKQVNLETIVSFISNQSSEFEFGKKFVENTIKTSPCVLMFDGFDEVLSHQINTATQILKLITQLKQAKVFVTTRPHMRTELENSLQVLGYTIQPFDETNQLNFILKYWESHGEVEANESVKLFAKSCLNSLNREMSEFENGIAGIPLQCRMLAETYIEHARRCSRIGYENYQDEQSVQYFTSIFEMYQKHLSMSFEKIRKSARASFLHKIRLLKRSKSREFNTIKRVHTYLALKLLFPNQAEEFKSLNDLSVSKSQVCGLGLIEGANSKQIRFVHRTFAEYLVAWFFVEKWKDGRKKLILSEIFSTSSKKESLSSPIGSFKSINSFQFKFPVICYFINGFIKHLCQQSNQKMEINNFDSTLLRAKVAPVVFALTFHNYTQVLMNLPKLFGNNEKESAQTMHIADLLLIVAKYGDVELMKLFCENINITNVQFPTSPDEPFMITPVHVAVQRGHYNLVEYLIKQYKSELPNLPYLIHFCVFHSVGESKATLKSKIQIIKLLCTKRKEWVNEPRCDTKKTPLMENCVDLELLECLIEEGADVNVCDYHEGTILHKIADYSITPEEYNKFLQLLDKNGFNLYNERNWRLYSYTPLHCAVKNLELLESTLQVFHSKGGDFNAVSCSVIYEGWLMTNKDSVLFHAIRGGRSLQFIRAIIDHGADIKQINKEGHTVLHICAEQGHLEALKYFIECHGMDINVTANDLSTPLHRAVLKRSEKHEGVQRFLISQEANLNAKTVLNRTPFLSSFHEGEGISWGIIELMEQNGLVVTGRIANEALNGTLSNNTFKLVGDAELVLEFLDVTQKTAVFPSRVSWNPWKFEKLQKNLHEIIKVTNVTPILLQQAKNFHLLTKDDLIEIEQIPNDSLKSERFYELVKKTNGSYQSFCMSLLYGNQFHAFLLLKCHLQSTLDWGNVWATPPPSVSSFICSKDKKLMVLISKDVDLDVSRLEETIDTLLPVIGEHGLASLLPVDKLTIFECGIANNQIIKKLESVITPGGKIICVCGEVSGEISNCEVITESFGWEDVSTTFSSWFRCTVGFSLVNFCDLFVTPEIIQVFGSYLLLSFKRGEACLMTELKLGHEIKTREGHSLSTTLFQYFLPGKLLFLGITQVELKLFAKFGQRIGHFGEDVSQLDYIILENIVGIEDICKIKGVNQVNVHLIVHTGGNFKLVQTFGDDSKIKEFIEKPQICDNFPACGCERGYENLVFKCRFRFQGYFYENITKEYSTSLSELLPEMRELLVVQDSVDLWEIIKLLDKISVVNDSQKQGKNSCEKTEIKSGFEQLKQKIEELFAHLNIEERELRELKNLAGITLFPTRTKNLIINNHVLEKFVTAGLVVKKEDESVTLQNQSLACYLVVNMLIENELHENFVRDLFRDCIEHQTIKKFIPYFSSGVEVDFSSKTTIKYQHISFESFKFTNGQLVKFLESLTFNHYETIEQLMKNHIPPKSTIPWVYACVHANHFNLLKILLSVESNATAFQSEQQIILAVIYGRVQVIDLVVSHYVSQTSKQISQIKLKISDKEMDSDKAVPDAPQKSKFDKEFLCISLLHLAALRGNYLVMEYLLNHFINEKLTQSQMLEILRFCVVDTLYHDGDQIGERIRMIHLFFKIFPNYILTVQSDSDQQNPLFVPNIHVDLLQVIINKGLDDECSLRGVLHFCPTYMTPYQYDILVKFLDTKGKVGVVNCSVGKWKCSPLYRAVQHLELFDSTLHVFSCAKADFNCRILSSAVDHKRSASLLERLIRAGADFRKEEEDGASWTVLHHAAFSYNLTALRYFIWRGCDVNAKDSNGNTPLHIVLKNLRLRKVTHELVETLVQHGADVNVVGEEDQTPLSIAVEEQANMCLDKWTFEVLERVAEKSVHTG